MKKLALFLLGIGAWWAGTATAQFAPITHLPVNVCDSAGAGNPCGDTVKVYGAVSCSPASHVITVTQSLPASYVGANTVVGGCGAYTAKVTSANGTGTIVVVSGGTSGFAAGDTITLADGCTTHSILKVLTVASGVVTAVAPNPGSPPAVCTTAPSSPVSQGSTSGSGVGTPTFTVAYAGVPLTGTITAVGTNQFTISSTPVATISAVTEWWAVGHDDAPAITKAIATGASSVYFPAQVSPTWSSTVHLQYGVYSQINLPNTYQFTLDGQGGSVNALATMNAPFQILAVPGGVNTLVLGNSIHNLTIDGLAQSTYDLDLEAAGWIFFADKFLNALTTNVAELGSSNASNSQFLSFDVSNDLTLLPNGGSNLNLIDSGTGNSDGHFTDFFAHTSLGGFHINGGGQFVTLGHIYQVMSSAMYDAEGIDTTITSSVGDNAAPGQATFFINAGFAYLNAWTTHLGQAGLTYNGQYGVYVNVNNYVSIGCGGVDTPASIWAGNTANIVVDTGAGPGDTNAIAYSCIPLAPAPAASVGISQYPFTASNLAAGATGYVFMGAATSTSPVYAIVPRGGTFKYLYWHFATTVAGGAAVINVNYGAIGSLGPSSVTCTIPVGQNNCQDTTDSQAVTAGQAISVVINNTANTNATGIMGAGLELDYPQ
jgi:hypothetical protein